MISSIELTELTQILVDKDNNYLQTSYIFELIKENNFDR